MDEFEYLTVDDVEELHDRALELFGGTPGREPGKLESALAGPYSGYGEYELYATIWEKAAVYLYKITGGHSFTDGNKRTGFVAAFVFLDWNGYDLIVDDEEMYEFVLKVADDKRRPSFDEVVDWIIKYSYKREESKIIE